MNGFMTSVQGIDLRHIETVKAAASEKGVSCRQLAVCHLMTLQDVSNLPSIDSSGVSLKFGKNEDAVRMIQNFPYCCVLDAEGKPASWILTYASCAIGLLYTLPEHRGRGYAKVLVSTMARRLRTEGYPVYCFIKEDNMVSYKLFKNLGFIEDPSYRAAWFDFNDFKNTSNKDL